jgi:Zn-dependent metalloprotease
VFSAVYRQWRLRQSAERADWTIASTIIGPAAYKLGYRHIRSLSNPNARDCVSVQPNHYRDYDKNGDPHINSGIPNHAFYLAAMALGGNTWDRVGLVWYASIANGRRQPNMTFHEFAQMTVTRAALLFRTNASVPKAIEKAWRDVGVL